MTGARCVEQIRSVDIELDIAPTRVSVHTPNPSMIKDVAGMDTEANRQSVKGLDHLTSWARALKTARG